MNKAKRWLRIPSGALEGLYQLELWTGELDPDKLPKCPCCQGELKPGYDICQWGMFEDNYRSYVICPSCVKAWELLYNVPTYAMFTKREQKRLFTSKTAPAKPGEAMLCKRHHWERRAKDDTLPRHCVVCGAVER